VHRGHHVLDRTAAGDESRGPGFGAGEDFLLDVRDRDGDDLEIGQALPKRQRRVEPAARPDVEQQDVRMQLRGLRLCVPKIRFDVDLGNTRGKLVA
jgi:hypothetical protein